MSTKHSTPGRGVFPGVRAGRIRGLRMAVAAVLLVFALRAASPASTNAGAEASSRIETFRHGDVEITMIIDPGMVSLDRDMQLTIRASSPSALDVELPSLDKRLAGFQINRSYDREPSVADGRVVKERCVLLTPVIAEEYRIAPLVVRYSGTSPKSGEKGWFPTRPVQIASAPLLAEKPARAIADILPPVWIPPSWKTAGLWCLLVLGVLLAGWLCVLVVLRIRNAIRLRRLSPRERALRELAALLSRRLIDLDRVKDFYVELTMIVRRYVERAHGIRAPEQTTEEFLEAVARDSRFTAEVARRLRAFLESADLVKYAAFRPPAPVVDGAVRTSREFIDSDAANARNDSQGKGD